MVNFHCIAEGCTNDSRKKENVKKYPEMLLNGRVVDFYVLPSAKKHPKIKQYCYSEPQAGKSYCDSKMKWFAASGNDILTASDIKHALDSGADLATHRTNKSREMSMEQFEETVVLENRKKRNPSNNCAGCRDVHLPAEGCNGGNKYQPILAFSDDTKPDPSTKMSWESVCGQNPTYTHSKVEMVGHQQRSEECFIIELAINYSNGHQDGMKRYPISESTMNHLSGNQNGMKMCSTPEWAINNPDGIEQGIDRYSNSGSTIKQLSRHQDTDGYSQSDLATNQPDDESAEMDSCEIGNAMSAAKLVRCQNQALCMSNVDLNKTIQNDNVLKRKNVSDILKKDLEWLNEINQPSAVLDQIAQVLENRTVYGNETEFDIASIDKFFDGLFTNPSNLYDSLVEQGHPCPLGW